MFPIPGLLQPSLLLVVFVFVGVILFFRRGGSAGIRIGGPTLVLRKFQLQESPRDGVFLRIVGRASGIMGWLLTVVGLDVETSLEVTREKFSVRKASLGGQEHHVAPLPNVSSTHCGYLKPIWLLALGGILVLISLIVAVGEKDFTYLIAGLVAGGVCLLFYFLQRKLAIWAVTSSGLPLGLTFKPSVIENVSVDMNKALQAITVVNSKILESQHALAALAQATASSPPAPAGSGAPALCRNCGAKLEAGSTFCDGCGAKLA